VCVWVRDCSRDCVCEREEVCVFVCVRERREREFVRVGGCEKERKCVCMHVKSILSFF